MALAGRHAFVTGGGRGIGRAIAAVLSRAGATVTVIGRSEAPLRETVAAGDAAGCGIADVTDMIEVKREVTAAEAARGPVDILINNAGSVESGPFIKADPAVFRTMWNVHLMGAVYASQAVLPGMIERGFGRIVNIASTAGVKGYAYVSAYCAAKHALVGLTRALAADPRRHRERDLPRLYRHRAGARQHRSRRHENRAPARGIAGRVREGCADRPADRA
jgi:NAD(P)-dependent dehydrogenase (short-subunit alcohol dehydrogenase family)